MLCILVCQMSPQYKGAKACLRFMLSTPTPFPSIALLDCLWLTAIFICLWLEYNFDCLWLITIGSLHV